MIPGLSADDARLTTLILRAEELIAGWLRWPPATFSMTPRLERQTYTFYLNGPHPTDPSRLVLPMRPVIFVTSVTDDPDRVYPISDVVPSTDYETEQIEGEIDLLPLSTHAWSTSSRAINVICDCGFNTVGVKDYIKQALAAKKKHLWDSRHTQGTVSATQGGQSQTRTPEVIPATVRQMVGHLRLWEVGFG